MITRRTFLGTSGATTLGGALATQQAHASRHQRKRIAIITTVWHYQSHAQHMGDRFLVGYPTEGRWHMPDMEVASLFVHQQSSRDQSADRSREFGFEIYRSISETLRLGGKEIAVDGVLLIGEHGKYPRNELGQILYPRYDFFQEIENVFREDKKSVPVFNDKHLSYDFTKAKKMVAASRELNFPFMAGSSLPVTWRLPSVEMPLNAQVEQALMIGVGGISKISRSTVFTIEMQLLLSITVRLSKRRIF